VLARDIMTREVITISADAKIHELTKLLAERGISGLPVCDEDGRVIGIVSETDLIGLKNGSRVRDIMSREVICVTDKTPVQKVAAILHGRNIKRVPVLIDNRIAGIISRSDIVAAMAKYDCEIHDPGN